MMRTPRCVCVSAHGLAFIQTASVWMGLDGMMCGRRPCVGGRASDVAATWADVRRGHFLLVLRLLSSPCGRVNAHQPQAVPPSSLMSDDSGPNGRRWEGRGARRRQSQVGPQLPCRRRLHSTATQARESFAWDLDGLTSPFMSHVCHFMSFYKSQRQVPNAMFV